MKTVTISKSQFLIDKESMTVEALRNKYKLTLSQYYRLIDQLGIKKRKKSDPKKIEVVD